jgi:hypothetical protein
MGDGAVEKVWVILLSMKYNPSLTLPLSNKGRAHMVEI